MSKKTAAVGGGPEHTMPGPPPPPPKKAPAPKAEVKPMRPAAQGVNKSAPAPAPAPKPSPKQAQAKPAQAPAPKPQQKPRVNAAGRLQAFSEGRQKLAPSGPQPHQVVGRAAATGRPTDAVKVASPSAGQALEKKQAQARSAAGPQATKAQGQTKPSPGRSPSR